MRRLLKLVDRRRWRGVYMALTADAWFAFGWWECDGSPSRDAVVAVIDNDEARVEVLRVAEERLAATISTGMFDKLPDWLPGRVDDLEPPPEPEQRLDPRRFAAMRDVATGQGFLSIAVWDDGAHAATALMADEHQADALQACERLADALRNGELDAAGGRYEWFPPDGTDGGDAA